MKKKYVDIVNPEQLLDKLQDVEDAVNRLANLVGDDGHINNTSLLLGSDDEGNALLHIWTGEIGDQGVNIRWHDCIFQNALNWLVEGDPDRKYAHICAWHKVFKSGFEITEDYLAEYEEKYSQEWRDKNCVNHNHTKFGKQELQEFVPYEIGSEDEDG